MEEELWAVVPGHADYQISNLGRVKSFRKGPPRILKPTKARVGYLQITLPGRPVVYVHHLVAEAFLGPRPKGLQINHKDGDKTNNAATNLEYCGHGDNVRHMFRTGLTTGIAETHVRAILNNDQVRRIKSRLANGEHPRSIAPEFGVSISTIYAIKGNYNWKSISLEQQGAE